MVGKKEEMLVPSTFVVLDIFFFKSFLSQNSQNPWIDTQEEENYNSKKEIRTAENFNETNFFFKHPSFAL